MTPVDHDAIDIRDMPLVRSIRYPRAYGVNNKQDYNSRQPTARNLKILILPKKGYLKTNSSRIFQVFRANEIIKI